MVFPRTPASVLRALTVFLVIGFLAFSGAAPLDAAEKKKKKSRKNFIPSESVGKKLMKIQEFMEEEQWEEALGIITPLTQKKRLKKFDKANLYMFQGFNLGALERYDETLVAFENALAIDYLPDSATQQLKYNLGQLYLGQQNYDRAIELFEDWLANAEKPDAQASFMITIAYVGKDDWPSALVWARKSVDLSASPVENRLRLQLAAEFQNGNMPEVLETLKTLATLFPKKDYYLQLAHGYSQVGQEEDALALLELAYLQNFLDKERDLTNLTQRYLYHSLPWPGAKVMQKGLEDEIIETNSENLELYANSLLHAREYDMAIGPLTEAAETSEDGDLYHRVAQVHIEVENWKSARKALEKAVQKGSLRDEGSVQLLLGIANFNEKRYVSARKAFNEAAKNERNADSASKWLEHVERASSANESQQS
ncbi:MAG: hypothetical protein CL917_09625 [Deltaproteobacteria bacterium]|nr:hypothetical protein [Deltaproteobacteria bacterium]